MLTATTRIFSPTRMRAMAEANGVSNRRLAKAIGNASTENTLRSYAYRVRRYASGHMVPKPETVEKLADALGCEARDLYVEVEL